MIKSNQKCNFCIAISGEKSWSNPSGKLKVFDTRDGTKVAVCEFCENQSRQVDNSFISFTK